MFRIAAALAAALVLVAALVPASDAGRVAGTRVDGAWRLVDSSLGAGVEHTKVLAGGRFVWTTTRDGAVVRAAGGRYEVRGRRYVEHIDFVAHKNDAWMVGKTFTFKRELKRRRWHHSGVLDPGGRNVDLYEVWERVGR